MERINLSVALIVVLLFGAALEERTALRRTPMTDLGVPACAGWEVMHGTNLYTFCEWHGWHYGYPPALAILFTPLACPACRPPPGAPLAPGELRTEANTPWGPRNRQPPKALRASSRKTCASSALLRSGHHLFSVVLIALSTHAIACVLDGTNFGAPPPLETAARRRWWLMRTLPLLACAGSLITDLSRGQSDILMLAAISLGLYFAARAREFSSGLLLAIPAAIKLFPVLLLIYPFWRRRWKMILGGFGGLVLFFIVIPVAALGPQRTVDVYGKWIEVLAKPGLGIGTDTSRGRELTYMNGTDNQSLLAFFHNWRYHDLRRDKRPPKALPSDRLAVYVIGAVMLLSVAFITGFRRTDAPRDLLFVSGLFIGLALVVSPVVHNYYYLLLLPVITALLDRSLESGLRRTAVFGLASVSIAFTLIDILARMPSIGHWLRDVGAPLLSVIALLSAASFVMLRPAAAAARGEILPQPKPVEILYPAARFHRNQSLRPLFCVLFWKKSAVFVAVDLL